MILLFLLSRPGKHLQMQDQRTNISIEIKEVNVTNYILKTLACAPTGLVSALGNGDYPIYMGLTTNC